MKGTNVILSRWIRSWCALAVLGAWANVAHAVGFRTGHVINNTGTNVSWRFVFHRNSGAGTLASQQTPTGSSGQPTGTTVDTYDANSSASGYPHLWRVEYRDSFGNNTGVYDDESIIINDYEASTEMTFTLGPPVDPEYWITVRVFNFTSYDQYSCIVDDNEIDTCLHEEELIPPGPVGQAGVLIQVGPFDSIFEYSIKNRYTDGSANTTIAAGTNGFSVGSPGSSGPEVVNSPKIPTTGTNNIHTTNITYTSTTDLATINREGFSAVRGAIKEGTDNVANKVEKAGQDIVNAVNGLDGFQTNALTLTELRGTTNIVQPGDTAGQQSTGNAATAANGGTTLANALSGFGSVGSSSSGTYPIGEMTMNLGIAGVIDLNPANFAPTANIGTMSRQLAKWVLTVSFLIACWSVLGSHIQALGSVRQATASGQTILGTNANVVTALAAAALITVVLAAVPALALTIGDKVVMNAISFQPFTVAASVSTMCANAVGIADMFFPLDLSAFYVCNYILFRVSISGVWFVAVTVCRFIVG